MVSNVLKYKSKIKLIWTDPVWSKVISAVVLVFIGLIYSFFQTVLKEVNFFKALNDILNYKIEFWKIFIITFIVLIVWPLFQRIRKKKNIKLGTFNTEEKIGNFVFRELHNALLTHKLNLPKSLVSDELGAKMDISTLFILFQRQLNIGVNWDQLGDQGMFAFYDLGPILMSYGLTEKASEKNKTDTLGLDIIQTSELGMKYLSHVEKWRVFNDENITDNILRTQQLKFKPD